MDTPSANKPRILVVTDKETTPFASDWDVVRVREFPDALARLQHENFDGLFLSGNNIPLCRNSLSLLQQSALLEFSGEGIAVLGSNEHIIWANGTFERWSVADPQGHHFAEALGLPLNWDSDALKAAFQGVPNTSQIHLPDHRILELRLQPMLDARNKVHLVYVIGRDISSEVQQQKKLEALHQAANELSNVETSHRAETPDAERIELLKQKIVKLTRELLHYDVIEIRLLDSQTGELKPLLAEGMTPEAANRVLYAKMEGNGTTGYVAATGKTHVCNDASCDPFYIEGAKGARSSLTVALKQGETVIGTFNVESPQIGGFSADDVRFAEIFCRELSTALHTLDLLMVEKKTAAAQSIDAINREVGLPVDEILTAATSILDRWIGHEPEMADRLKKIISNARIIKESIQRVGEDMSHSVKPLTLPGTEEPSKLNLRVLVVDNDKRVRQTAHGLLGRLGCIVETAQDGREAITLAKLSTYDAMLADIRLPDMGGYEVYQALRKAQPNSHVILMTGYGYDASHSLVKARQDGLRHVLFKPFRVDQMLNALRNPPASNGKP